MDLRQFVTSHFSNITGLQQAASVWSGCGEIIRCQMDGTAAVIKAIEVPSQINHSRIKQSDFALARKRQSYLVEFNWYRRYAKQLPHEAAAIHCIEAIQEGSKQALLFSDFSALGYQQASATHSDIQAIINWLAHFHAFHLASSAGGLWPRGSYWHLATRPDELQRMSDLSLKAQAQAIDTALSESPYQTLIHGDAKLANFAILPQNQHVLGYDFQYVGKGIGVIDVMYFLGSCLDDAALKSVADDYLNRYFDTFTQALKRYQPSVNPAHVVSSWQALWCYAWSDFYRFLAGWSPDHAKINGYMQQQFVTYLEIKD